MTLTPVLTPTNDQSLCGRALLLARIGWVVVTLVTVGLDLYAIPSLYRLAATPCPDQGPCGDPQFTVSQLAQLHAQGLSATTLATLIVVEQTAAMLLFVALASVLFWRRSDDHMALFCAYMLVTFGGTALNLAAQALPTTNFAGFLLITTLAFMGQAAFVTFFFMFPDGRFVPRWTRWVALILALMLLAEYFPGLSTLAVIKEIRSGPFLIIAVLLVLVLAQIYRYRRVSNAQQRQQTKWVIFGFVIFLVGTEAFWLPTFTPLGNTSYTPLAYQVYALFLPVVPISFFIAVLRYRLYDIDVIIRRTLVYGSLTAILASVYFVGVVGTQTLIGRVAGQPVQQQPLVIVITTLLIAALFQPLRGFLQKSIDQRFYRTKYDVERTLATFGVALRSDVDLDRLRSDLVTVVEETMQPEHTSLWLRPSLPAGVRAIRLENPRGDA